MTIGIVGLGLIGGSLAKAISRYTEHRVFGYDIDASVIEEARSRNVIDRRLSGENASKCDLLILAVYPDACIDFVKTHADAISPDSVVIDCCGVKSHVCDALEPIAAEKGFTFIGCHPMAGLHMSGFAYSTETLFKNASFVVCPSDSVPYGKIKLVTSLAAQIGFTNIQMSTPQEHDTVIAFTSQLCHIVSNCFVKNEAAKIHSGFSAGSYRDLTRVAKLNEDMWTELFLENRENLIKQLDEYLENLHKYADALHDSDAVRLKELLREGRILKETIDGQTYRD